MISSGALHFIFYISLYTTRLPDIGYESALLLGMIIIHELGIIENPYKSVQVFLGMT